MPTEIELPENEENKILAQENIPQPADQPDTMELNPTRETPAPAQNDVEKFQYSPQENSEEEQAQLSLPETLHEMEHLLNKDNAGAQHKKFGQLKDLALLKIQEETEDKKQEFTESGNAAEDFAFQHPSAERVTLLANLFKEKQDQYHKSQEAEHAASLAAREEIIEKLKNLYTNTEAGTNLFKAIREIKEEWSNAGQVSKAVFKNLNNNYFFHLNRFYEMLDMNKEYLEQEYSHNLEKRKQIIERAKELQNEPAVQKALNELQYLHKLWKEEAGPVAEEFRDKTWEEFREISNKIHEKKAELEVAMEAQKEANLQIKNRIISEIRALAENAQQGHGFWQQAIKKVEELRAEFLKTGSVPKKLSTQNWNDLKQTLRDFNTAKNDFYKNLKGNQATNLEEKQKLVQTAQENMSSEDWDTAVPLFKKLQEDWKQIGHVPRSHANKIWEEFREACNTFFKNFREKNAVANDNWKENYRNKKALLEELGNVTSDEGSVAKIEEIKEKWNGIGKVPREKISINTEFNKLLREKLKLNKISEFDLKDEGLSDAQVTDKARKIKNQIADLEAEIATLENNLGFFSNPSRENPLLKDTYNNIDGKKQQLASLKATLHQILSAE